MINLDTAWDDIRLNAQKAQITNCIWGSLIELSPYRIEDMLDDRIIIRRINKDTLQPLTRATIEKAAKRFNERNCKVARSQLISPSVAEETAFVLFHPKLTWGGPPIYEFIVQVED